MVNRNDGLIFVKMAQFESISRGAYLPRDYAHTLSGRYLRRKPIKFDSGYRFPR
jgi:hypothetical protein